MSGPDSQPPDACDARAPFNTPLAMRRLAYRLDLDETARVLELGAEHASAGLLLAVDPGCLVTVVAEEPDLQARLRTGAEHAGVERRWTLLEGSADTVRPAPGGFDLVFAGRPNPSPEPFVRTARDWLARNGRVGIVAVVAVGHRPDLALRGAWERHLGGPLPAISALLQMLERTGFEPEWSDALGDAELLACAAALGSDEAEDAERLRSAGRAGVTLACVGGRRREPGEKPRASRDRG